MNKNLLGSIGVLMAFASGCIIAYFAFLFDTTVEGYSRRVHNLGLMQDRMIGIIVGITFLVLGVCFLVGSSRRK